MAKCFAPRPVGIGDLSSDGIVQGAPLDPRFADLFRDELKVDGFRVGCLVAEEALKMSIRVDVGATGLSTLHLGQTVKMRLDGYSGEKHVKVHETDRELAVRIAKRVRIELNRLGFEVKSVRILVEKGKQGEEHDLVLELVNWADDHHFRKISCELKRRRMMSKTGLKDVREAMQRECIDECAWWVREAETSLWAGRVIISCNFPKGASNPFDVYVDFTPVGDVARGLSGWPYSRRNFLPKTKEVKSYKPAPPSAKVVAKAVTKGKAVARPVRARHVKKPFPRLSLRRWKGRLVAPLAPVVEAATRKTAFHLERKFKDWASRVPNGFADQAPRQGCKRGGKQEYVATEPVLQWVYDNLS
jgi:hypothetical protein